jgi:hypothetical protein
METRALIGKTILVGLTYLKANGKVRERKQLHGTIKAVGEHTLSFERADGSGRFAIPFDGSLEEADPDAVYKLRSTGEAVSGIHFLVSYTVHPPKAKRMRKREDSNTVNREHG